MTTKALVSFVGEQLRSIAKDRFRSGVEKGVDDLYSIAKHGLSSLFGVENEVAELSSTFSAIQAVLEDAERHQVTDKQVRDWLLELKEVAYEAEDILDEWVTDAFISQEDKDETRHPKRVGLSFFSPYQSYKQVKLQYDIGKRIRETTEKLNKISIRKEKFKLKELITREDMLVPNKEERQTSSLVDESEIFGRDDIKKSIIEQLVSETSQEEKSVSIVSIVGMGGLGKTTLAQLIYNDERVMANFKKNRIWVCVSEPYDVNRIAMKVIESMGGRGSTSNNPDLDNLHRNLREAIDKKKFLLVLDDVWDESGHLWQKLRVPLMGAAPGSKVVVTTRSREAAAVMDTPRINVHELGILSNSDCWEVFNSRALKGTEEENCPELMKIGEEIVKKCNGVPLAARAVGSVLRRTREKRDWEHVLESEIWKWDIPNDDIRKGDVLPALLLSYDILPSHWKRCFSFCSVFPKDHVIEKDELVKLWMAHGIIKSEEGKKDDTETVGEKCFYHLLTRSLFQDAEKDRYGNIVRCRMHDLVHDLATFVSSGDYRNMKAGDSELRSIKCHHLSLLVNEDVSSIPSPLCSAKRLHTLLLFGYSGIEAVPDILFNDLRFLRVLDLSGTQMKNLPSSLGKLKLLRYLSLCRSNIKELPEFVTDLCNLQTLKLNKCACLCLLPSGMSKMVKMRHLEIKGTGNLKVLPNGLGRLTSLRTLSKFPVGDENGGCKIGELKDLNLLRGKLSIENLERIMDVNDASKAELHKKSDLQVLSLCCSYKTDEEWRMLENEEMERMDSVLERLTPPHSNLKELKIKNYAGSMFPSWLEGSRFYSLVKVELGTCKRLSSLPEGLGHLKALQTLEIRDCEGLSSLPEGLGQLKALQTLHIEGCERLSSLPEGLGQLKALQTLHIKGCERFLSLPEGLGQLKALQTLEICYCGGLSSLPKGLGQLKALQTLKICYCGGLSSLPEGLRQLKALQTLEIWNCEGLSSLPEGLGQLKALQTLEIRDCGGLSSLPEGLGQLKALQTLKIWNCEGLSSLPEGLRQLKALQTLEIWNCEGLSSLPEGLGHLKALQTLEIRDCGGLSSLPEGLGQLKALQTLEIWGCGGLSSMPEGLGQLKALQTLEIRDCGGFSSLPEGLGQLKALQTLEICYCGGLSSLPEGLGQLKALQTLKIWDCGGLSSLPEGLGQLKALQTLEIWGCVGLSSLPEGLGQLKALQTLEIWNYGGLSSLPEGLGQLKALQTLGIRDCGGLSSLPEGLGQLKALQTLEIYYCGGLSSLPEGLGQLKALQTLEIQDCGELSSLPEGLGQLKALQNLQIYKCERLSCLPEGLGKLKALQILYIRSCERLSSLFDGFEQLQSLCVLTIHNCPQLRRPLPNLQGLTTLESLSIQRCPHLTEQLEKEKGEDWYKISHIPHIDIDENKDEERPETVYDFSVVDSEKGS